jgi:hypothetical protein
LKFTRILNQFEFRAEDHTIPVPEKVIRCIWNDQFFCTPKLKTQDEGMFAVAFIGYGSGTASTEVQALDGQDAGTFSIERGGLGLTGIQGGAWLGWGLRTSDDLYFGAEISGAGSDEKFEVTSTKGFSGDVAAGASQGSGVTAIEIQRLWTAGGALRVGYYVNQDTLFALKVGVAVSAINVDFVGGASSEETYFAGGPQVGASLETKLSKIDPNLSLRLEWTYTDFLTADVGGQDGTPQGSVGTESSINATVTGTDTASRIGIKYNF